MSARSCLRLFASDLDGTLVRSDGVVSPASRAALARLADAGVLVVFVTGRPPRWLSQISDQTGHTGVAVAANGAVLYDLGTETVLAERTMTPSLLATLTADLRDAFEGVRFAAEHGTSFAYEPGYRHDWEISPSHDHRGNPLPAPFVGPLEKVIACPAVKLLVKDYHADPDCFLAAATEVVGERATVTTSSTHGLLEIAAPGVTKASGLAEVAAARGITAEQVVAIGDMPNDIAMLTWAGHGYAVANAHPSVLAIATDVLPSNDDDGVATLIDRLLAD